MDGDSAYLAVVLGRRVHDRLARALRDRDALAGSGGEPPGALRDCLNRAATSAAYRELLQRHPLVEDAFELYGFWTGRIDAWYELDGHTAVVVDWKTGEPDPRGHRVQRVVYALALLCHYETVTVATVNIGPHVWRDGSETFMRHECADLRAELAGHDARGPH